MTTKEQIEQELDTYIAKIEEDFDSRQTWWDRLADTIAFYGGSWKFIGWMMLTLIIWIGYNLISPHPFDPFPFILLNLMLSFTAAFQAPVIMMSQNRKSEKDDYYKNLEFRNNYISFRQTMELHEMIKTIKELGLDEKQELRLVEKIESMMEQLIKKGSE